MDTADVIDWGSDDNTVLLNPRMPEAEKQLFSQVLEHAHPFKGHIFLTTSGSSGKLKWVALSKKGVLASAKAVNAHLQSDRNDVWLNPLPCFHVGGLGIIARAFLSSAQVVPFLGIEGKWDADAFAESLASHHATLTSLVPAQVYDLVQRKMRPPESLRAIIVGGGALAEAVYLQAVALGWKLLPSYGMTECCSQVATASLNSWNENRYPLLHPLAHVDLGEDAEGFLKIRSPALLSAYIFMEEGCCRIVDPKIDGWFTSEDKAVFHEGGIKRICRGEQFIKIGGESVDLLRLEMLLEEVKLAQEIKFDAALIAMADERLGHVIHLAVDGGNAGMIGAFVEGFAEKVFPFERIRHVHAVEKIPRSPLKKVLKADLQQLI